VASSRVRPAAHHRRALARGSLITQATRRAMVCNIVSTLHNIRIHILRDCGSRRNAVTVVRGETRFLSIKIILLIKYSIMEPVPSPRPATDRDVGLWRRENWTTDGGPPVCFVYYNAHGAIRPDSDNGLPRPQTGTNGMDLSIFSTIGDKYSESFTGIIKTMKDHPEYVGKGIDRCLPSMLRRVSRNVAAESGVNPDAIFGAVIDEAKKMYEAAEIHISPDDFRSVTNPDTPTYFQLYQNRVEAFRDKPTGMKELPLRAAAAGDKLSSTQNDYGVWVFYTNLKIFKDGNLSLDTITEDALIHERVNRHSKNPDNLFLPSELTKSINMVSRANNKPIGAVNWIHAIESIGPMREAAGERAKIRAITAIGNLWKTRVTTLHEILDIFAPFHLKGEELGFPPLKLTMLSTTCRVLRRGFHFPSTDKTLPDDDLWDSQEFYHGRRSPSPPPAPPSQESILMRLYHRFVSKEPERLPGNIHDAVSNAMAADEPWKDSELSRPRSPPRSPPRSAKRSRKGSGGTKRKKHTRRRRRQLRTRQ